MRKAWERMLEAGAEVEKQVPALRTVIWPPAKQTPERYLKDFLVLYDTAMNGNRRSIHQLGKVREELTLQLRLWSQPNRERPTGISGEAI